VRSVVEPVRAVQTALEEFDLLAQMGADEGEEHVIADLDALVQRIEADIEKLDFRVMLGGPNDRCGAYVQFSPGAGGVDSCDWAGMLYRMYARWAERKGFKVTELERTDEPEGGIRSATLQIDGDYAFGRLKAEIGVHRLVRISPFDSQARRHTAFASVDVTPELDEKLAALYGQKGEIAFGSQIRSYVLHPYQMVKDHRTGYETGNIQAVLDGDIDGFIEEYLRSRGGAKAAARK